MKELSSEQLQAGREAVMQNVQELVDEAQSLFVAGRFARATALCQTSGEELGKYILLTSQLVDVVRGEIKLPWSSFWRHFKDHKEKSKYITYFEDVFLMDNLPPAHREQLSQSATDLEVARQRMLYVDCIDGTFYSPAQLATPEMAADALKWAQGRLELMTLMHEQSRSITQLAPELLVAADAELRRRALEIAGGSSTSLPAPSHRP